MAKCFGDGIDGFRLEFKEGTEKTMRGVAIKLWSAIIKATPVDSGRARSNWFATGQQIVEAWSQLDN